MSAVSGSVASGHTVPKDRCAESVLQRPPLSRRGIRPRNVAGRNCRLCSAPWMLIDVTEAHNLADGNAEKLQAIRFVEPIDDHAIAVLAIQWQ